MRVLHVIPSAAPRYGGPSRAVVAMCRALDARGVETLLASTDADGDQRLPVACGTEVDSQGVRSIFFRRQWSESYKYSRSMAAWIERNVKDFDLVHIHGVFSHASSSAARSCRKNGIPYVLRPLGNLSPWGRSQHAWRKLLFLALGGRAMIEGAAAVHATSEGEQRDVKAAFRRARTFVVPLGVDEWWFGPSGSSGPGPSAPARAPLPEPYVLFLGRLHPKKNVDLLIEAFDEAASDARLLGCRLVIAGEGEAAYVRRLRAISEGVSTGSRIDFAGWVDGAGRRALLSGAALVVLPSSHENFGLAVAESLVAGVPVILSNGVDLAPDVLRAEAGWSAPLTRPGLAAAMGDAMRDPAERARRGANGRALGASKFRWDSLAASLEGIYREVLRDAPAGVAGAA